MREHFPFEQTRLAKNFGVLNEEETKWRVQKQVKLFFDNVLNMTVIMMECHGMRTIEESESQSTIEEFYFTFCHVANYWKQ
uniref:Uncharacterized protein n=1 Tax=Caenorhabditis japonica TaxID=281687 RepID=A0A8R1IHB7_CAEJA